VAKTGALAFEDAQASFSRWELLMSVYTKLNQARMLLAKRKLEKTGQNKFAGYRYFELGDFLQPVQEIFDAIGLCGVVSFTETIATLTIVDTEDNSQIVITSPMGSAALKGVHEVQNIGAVETYQRRYLWVAALEIVEHDALDATTFEDGKAAPVKSTVIRPSEECFKSLQPEVQDLLRKAAPRITAAMPDVEQVMERVAWVLNNYPPEDQNDVRAGLEWLLDSKTRSAIKAHEAAQ
jgi:ERF superfamily